ncbi:PIG-L deacetylase family protein [Magnetococcales bacterium HHB-1]
MKKIKEIVRKILIRNPRKANYKFILKDWSPLFDLKASQKLLETKRFTQNISPILLDGPEADRILIISPHADDDIFGAGGTLLKCIEKGGQVKTVHLTRLDDPEKAEAVAKEALEASSQLGSDPTFLNLPIRSIPVEGEPVDKLAGIIDQFKPQAIFTTFLLDDHDDHRRANHLLMNSLLRTSYQPQEIWSYQVYSSLPVNVVVDVTSQIDAKERLARLFVSVSGNRDWAHYILGMNAMNCRFIPSRNKVYGETFFVVPINEFIELAQIYFSHPNKILYYNKKYHQ